MWPVWHVFLPYSNATSTSLLPRMSPHTGQIARQAAPTHMLHEVLNIWHRPGVAPVENLARLLLHSHMTARTVLSKQLMPVLALLVEPYPDLHLPVRQQAAAGRAAVRAQPIRLE